MLPQEIIRKKRDGLKLSADEINEFISGVTQDKVSEGQVASFCMAVLLNKMDLDERIALTLAMANSGSVLDWSRDNLGGVVVDKHSTGGVGDKVSLMLAPIVAACGAFVPMLSGRGLGHTGGTLDKMDSIAGYVSQPNVELLKRVVKDVGCAIVGATPALAPADRRIYSIRDVTATVESMDLIVASILSKKLAAGLQGLVMDVKFGSGAFLPTYDATRALAQNLVKVANGAGLKTVALLTDMNQILGRTAGNALEVLEAVEYLKCQNVDDRLHKVTIDLAAEMLMLAKITDNIDKAKQKAEAVLRNGRALEVFAKMVKALGGAADFVETPQKYLKTAPFIKDFYPDNSGYVNAVDVRAIGIGVVELGGGRIKPTDKVDHGVGLVNVAAIGEEVGSGAKPLATIHANSEEDYMRMAKVLASSYSIGSAEKYDNIVIKERLA